jgi:hypothetical protein
MKFDIFGKQELEVVRRNGVRLAFYCWNEGKKKRAQGIIIPASLNEREVIQYIDDLFQEWATPEKSSVKVISKV